MVGKEFEDLCPHGLGMVCSLGFDGEEEVDDTAGDEGD